MTSTGAGPGALASLGQASFPNSASASSKAPHYVLRLYVSGPTPASARAVVNARRLCEQHLAGRYTLEVLDIAEHVAMAAADQIVAAPTLVKLQPLPLRRLIGDMSNTERVLAGLDLAAARPSTP